MAIEKKCDNCQNMWCDKNTALFCEDDNSYSAFIPKEELVRQDERRIIHHLILNCNYCIEDSGKMYDVIVNKAKPKMIYTFEESVRRDERNKIIGQVIRLLKSDLETWDFSTTSVREYIKGTIELLEEEWK